MKKYFIFFFFQTVLISGFSQNRISIEKADCFLDDCEKFSKYSNIEFGYLHVPEDYENPDSRQIRVAFSIAKSTVDNPERDPILIFGGGWGYPIVRSTIFYYETMKVKNRDIILYDYRGTGNSKPNLCEDLGKKQWDLIRQDLSYKDFVKELNGQFYECFDSLNQQGIDYRNYGTEIKTRDALKLIEELGYSEVNLFGISNGTMGIQGFIRAAEQSSIKIRSIYSDSNVPMNEYVNGDLALMYKKTLDQVLDDCANDPNCENAYPNLKARFHQFLKKTINHPISYSSKKEFVFNTFEINSAIHQILYNNANYKDIPILLEAFMSEDFSFMAPMFDRFQWMMEGVSGTSIINYTYDWKARQAKVIKVYKDVLKRYPEFLATDMYLDFYATDTTITYNSRDTIPVTSNAPALVVAGTYDPVTPPESSRIMHKRYSNSYYFEFPRKGHGVFFSPCGNELFRSFVNNPYEKPDNSCVKALESIPIEFTTSIYSNTKVNQLIQEIGLKRNVFWILLLLVPLVISLLVFFRTIVQIIRKRGFWTLSFFQSILILLFLTGLTYYSFETIQLGGLTLLFGLVSSAWWLPWFTLFIVVMGLLLLYRMVKTSSYTFWKISILFSTALVAITAFSYGIYPL